MIHFSDCGTCNSAFNFNAVSADAAARELAMHPEWARDEAAQDRVCRKYGIFLDQITDDEASYISSLVIEYARAMR
jgi:hypothetical protein